MKIEELIGVERQSCSERDHKVQSLRNQVIQITYFMNLYKA